jgi:hypothetical protein
VGFADDDTDTTQSLLLTRSFEDTEQYIRLGMAIYHVEINDQGASCYGGISTLVLQPDTLTITFSPKGANDLGFDRAVIGFEVSPQELKDLKDSLSRVFAGSDVRATGLE